MTALISGCLELDGTMEVALSLGAKTPSKLQAWGSDKIGFLEV